MRRNREKVHVSIDDPDFEVQGKDTPEHQLLRAVLECAIMDCITPARQVQSGGGIPVKKQQQFDLVEEFRASKKSFERFVYDKGIKPWKLETALKSYQKKDYYLIKQGQLTGFEYIFEDFRDEEDEWSFEWILSHFVEDVDVEVKRIRTLLMELLKKNQNNLT